MLCIEGSNIVLSESILGCICSMDLWQLRIYGQALKIKQERERKICHYLISVQSLLVEQAK